MMPADKNKACRPLTPNEGRVNSGAPEWWHELLIYKGNISVGKIFDLITSV